MSVAWTPHDYQKRAVQILISQAAAGLFLDPGLGKSSIALAAFKLLRSRKLAKRMLLIAPLRPCYSVWPAEVRKWTDFGGLTYTILHGDQKEKRVNEGSDILIINPDGLQWLTKRHPELILSCDVLLVDESTQFKNTQTQRFKLLKPFMDKFARRWILTGTPVPNGIMDLFGQIYLLDLGRALGRYITHFRAEFFVQNPFNLYEWTPKEGSFEAITERIRPLIMRLSAEEWLAMPQLITTVVPVQLEPEVMERYREIEDEFLTTLQDEEIIAANAAAAGVKCRQIANGAVYDDVHLSHNVHTGKLDALDELLGELSGKPVLILYEFQHDVDRIRERHNAPNLSGLSGEASDRLIAQFNAGEIPILLGHPASMGHGLNLQGACHHVIWFGVTWNLEHYDQANARVYRQGQQSDKVFVYQIAALGTLDTKVAQVLSDKDRSQRKLLGALTS